MAMPKRKLDIVHNLPRAVYTGTAEPVVITDPVFFHKTQVHCGSRFQFYGRTIKGHPTTWVVEQIWTVTGHGRDKIKSSIYDVRTLDDILEMRCEETLQRRNMQFKYMSYSAIWRIPLLHPE